MIYLEKGSNSTNISSQELKDLIFQSLEKLGERSRVLVIPPDYTRLFSRAGEITGYIHDFYGDKLKDILPALGTHSAMTNQQIKKMFPGIPTELFLVHDWRNDTIQIGKVQSDYIKEVSDGLADFDWPVQINKNILNGEYDLILSIGQVVPHEVIGMANYNKNIFVGTGGADSINLSHYLGACYGMEKIMGKANNPVRSIMNYASDNFIQELPVVYIQTVIKSNKENNNQLCGLFIGNNIDCFLKASQLSEEVNITLLDKPLDKVVVYLDPAEYKSTWLGNKAIYRTRMVMGNNAELIIVGPGVKSFGEDHEIDRLIRKYSYSGTELIKKAVSENKDLKNNLSAAAHLIHGSSEGRFRIIYCPGKLSRKEIESAGYKYADPNEIQKIYNPKKLKKGFNLMPDGDKIYYIPNPAAGLWQIK